MATSGSFNFSLNRNELITQALRTMGILADAQSATASQISDGSIRLNSMIKAWRNRGISLPLYQELAVFLTDGTASYSIGATGDKATALDDFVKTELSTAGVATDATIEVDSITGITNGDFIGIELDDDTIQWTTINGAPAGTTITLTATLTGAAAIDNHIYTYTSIAQRPLTIKGARIRDRADNETPVRVVTREEYFSYVNKTATGKVVAVYYDPQITNGKLYCWPSPDAVGDVLLLTAQRQVADFDGSTDDPDFPVEWLDALSYGLAVRMLTKYGIDMETASQIRQDAQEYLMDAEDFDMEDYIQFVPASDDYE
mgnify:FL=1